MLSEEQEVTLPSLRHRKQEVTPPRGSEFSSAGGDVTARQEVRPPGGDGREVTSET